MKRRSSKPQPVLYVCNDCGLIALGNGEELNRGAEFSACLEDDLHDWRLVDWERIDNLARNCVNEYRASLKSGK